MNAVGKQVRLFLVDGTFGGLVTAEIMNWTGHILKGRRDQFGEICKRSEAQRTGVYILLGDNDYGDRMAYIGEADNVAVRLRQHQLKKDFWQEVVIITSKDANLTSAHVRYIESRLIQRAKKLNRVPLENANEPSGGAELPEADVSDMDYFIDQVMTLLPVLGVDMFRGRVSQSDAGGKTSAQQEDSPIFIINVKNRGGKAKAQIVDGEFTVLEGSAVTAEVTCKGNATESTKRQFEIKRELNERLREDGTLVVNADGTAKLMRDVQFLSPSAAAAFVQGRATANGRVEWRTQEGITFGQWESENQAQ